MKDLVIALFALVILYRKQSADKNCYAALKVPTLKQFFQDIPALKPTIDGFLKGDYDLSELSADLRTFTILYKKRQDSRASLGNLLAAFALWMKNDSPGAFKRIEENSASPAMPAWISPNFIKPIGDQKKVKSEIRALIKKMTGRQELGFKSPAEAEAAKKKFPEEYRAFLDNRKEFASIWKGFISNHVRSSGEQTVPYPPLEKEMAKKGIEHTLPTGFTGRIDANGSWYSPFGEPLTGTPPQANMFPTVRMNEDREEGSPIWVYQAIRADGTAGNYSYSQAEVKKRQKSKFEKVKDFAPMVDRVRNKWIQRIKKFNPNDEVDVACIVLELMFQFMARVGGRQNGMATLRRKHYTKTTGGFTLLYNGKDEVLTKHVFKARDPLGKLIVSIVEDLAKGKDKEDFLFTNVGPRGPERVGPAVVNKVFKAMGAKGITVHKIRTYHGTRIFNKEVEKIYTKVLTVKSPQEAMALLKDAATVVGKALNHIRTTADGSTKVTPSTALSAYIDPLAQVAFFNHYKMPLPKHLEHMHVEAAVRELDRESVVAARILAAEGSIDTKPKKMAEVPPPVNKQKSTPEKKTEDEEDSGVLPQFKTELTPEDETEEDLDKEQELIDKQEEKARKVLEKGAEKFSYLLTYGGNDAGFSPVDSGHFDNVLIEERFKKSEAP